MLLPTSTENGAVPRSNDVLDPPQPPPPIARPARYTTNYNPVDYLNSPMDNHPAVDDIPGFVQTVPYRLSEGRVPMARLQTASNPVRMTPRQPLNTLPIEQYEIYPSTQSLLSQRDEIDQIYFGGFTETNYNGVPPPPLTRQEPPRPQHPGGKNSPPDLGLMTFRVGTNGQSAVVIRHSEGHFQPGQLIESQSELAACFESRMCPICQEEWIWRGFTPAEMALLDSSGAEWEVARLPCGHIFHSACLAVWFHEGSPSCPCCRRLYRFREYRWSESFCFEGWRLRYNWQGDYEVDSPDAYLDGHPQYPSISRRVSFTIRSQSEDQTRAPYALDSRQVSPLQSHRRRHPSWTTLSSSGTVLRRTRRTSRYVSDTLDALGENAIMEPPEETVSAFLADPPMRDFQALTPDMTLHEPEYWNRYELEIGEEGEGGYEQINLVNESSQHGASQEWPHLDAYIPPQKWNTVFPPPGQAMAATRSYQPTTAEGGVGTSGGDNTQTHDSNIPLNELLEQWDTQSTIGDVLRDFHWIIAYVLEGMQQYEAGMASWPRVSPGFDHRARDLNAEDTEGNISVASASRRVLSLLESTGIPQAAICQDPGPRNATPRASKIPRLVRKDLRGDTPVKKYSMASEDVSVHTQEGINRGRGCQDTEIPLITTGSGKVTTSGKVGLSILGQQEILRGRDICPSRISACSVVGSNERASSSRSPDKRSDLRSRAVDFGNPGSKVPTLLARSGGGNTPSMKGENAGRASLSKGAENSPMGGRRYKMAGEMQTPVDFHFMEGRKLTRDSSPLTDNSIGFVKGNGFSDLEKDESGNKVNDMKENYCSHA